jgi:sodium-dependent dicarboxylate transporter 2/3/5
MFVQWYHNPHPDPVGVDALYFLTPVALSTSMALLLPMGTPPNAIVMSNNNLTVKTMLTTGLLCIAVYLVLILVYCTVLLPLVMPSLLHTPEDQNLSCDIN